MRIVILSGCLVVAMLLTGCGEGQPQRADATPAAAAPAPVQSPVPAQTPSQPATSSGTVYRWSPSASAADGRLVARGDGWNTLIAVPAGVLKGGRAYHAELAYRIITPPPYPGNPFPGTFHMYARSKTLGQGRDVWLNWLGDAGERGTARLPMTLAPVDDWTFAVGCKGPGEIVVESLAISEGDGFAFVPATAETTAPVAAPSPTTTGCPAVAIDPPAAGQGIEVSASEFGLVADSATAPVDSTVAAANALALHRAFVACRTRGASRLAIAPGTYRLHPKDPLELVDLHDLTIDGQGSLLIITKLLRNVAAFNLRGCRRLVVRDLRVDWDWTTNPIASLAVVESVAADRQSCTMRFPDLDPAGVEVLKGVAWTHITPIDPATFLPTGEPGLGAKVVRRETAGPGALTVGFEAGQPIVAGRHYLIRHLYYEMGAFKMGDCRHVQFERVTVHSIPGMGWIGGGDLSHLALRSCRIVPPSGTRRPMTTAADGFHILNSQGGILVEDCEFTRTGDDCINLHDNCAQGVRRTGPNSLVLVNNPRWRLKVQAGDRLELFRPDYAPIGHVGTAATVAFVGNDTVVDFAEPLPAAVSPLSIVFNRRYGTSDVRIVRSRFTHGRVMVSAQRATIEDCSFEHPFANAIQLHTEIVGNLWSEGIGASDVVIRGNRFHDVNLRGKFGGAVIYGVPVLPAGRTLHPLFRDILIEGNLFQDSRGPAVSLGACQVATVRGNRIEADGPVPGANAQAGSLLVECSSGLRLGGNTWKAGTGQAMPGVRYDPATCRDVQAGGNRLDGGR